MADPRAATQSQWLAEMRDVLGVMPGSWLDKHLRETVPEMFKLMGADPHDEDATVANVREQPMPGEDPFVVAVVELVARLGDEIKRHRREG